MQIEDFKHVSVLLNEVIEGLNINPDGIYVDGTIGGAGHSSEIIKRLSEKGFLIGIDRDNDAICVANERLKQYKNFNILYGNHDNIKEVFGENNIGQVDGILLDLGVSSYQIDEKSRGFSYMHDGDLDMRMDKSQEFSAKDIVNTYLEEDLARIIYEYGDEKFSRRIARNICEYRKNKSIETTNELVKIIEKSVPRKNGEGHPAKRTFQAIRIEVNNEIKPLYNTVIDSVDLLKSGGRLCIITFHSLEDRAVKNAFVDLEGRCTCPSDFPKCVCGNVSKGKIITKKPIIPTKYEMENNSRSRSAKLRIFERI